MTALLDALEETVRRARAASEDCAASLSPVIRAGHLEVARRAADRAATIASSVRTLAPCTDTSARAARLATEAGDLAARAADHVEACERAARRPGRREAQL